MTKAITQRIGFVGAGKMATALAGGFIKSGICLPDQIAAFDPSADAAAAFREQTGGATLPENADVLSQSDVVFLAVKPQHIDAVLQELDRTVQETHLVVSIIAGVSTGRIAKSLSTAVRIIRVMPNTPCLIGAGASAYALGEKATEEDAALLAQLLATVGIAVRVDESLMDAVTGLSGSGPAYVFQAIEALSDAGVRAGLPRQTAALLAAQTVAGAARLVLETGEHPATLKDAVASPGGTTIAGLHALEQGGLRSALIDAVLAAAARSAELGQSS